LGRGDVDAVFGHCGDGDRVELVGGLRAGRQNRDAVAGEVGEVAGGHLGAASVVYADEQHARPVIVARWLRPGVLSDHARLGGMRGVHRQPQVLGRSAAEASPQQEVLASGPQQLLAAAVSQHAVLRRLARVGGVGGGGAEVGCGGADDRAV